MLLEAEIMENKVKKHLSGNEEVEYFIQYLQCMV